MNVLFIGDVVADSGRKMLFKKLPELKKNFKIDLCIVNGENSACGNGVLPSSADEIFKSGADIITGGNHSFKRREIFDYMEQNECILRPYNVLENDAAGRGYIIYDMGKFSVCVINLAGTTYMDNYKNPFYEIDELLEKINCKIKIIDFHAEATSEKLCMAHYLDGRATALIGTHTHVRTADAQIFPNGLGYITDVGMTGPAFSVLGIDPQKAIKKLKSTTPVRFDYAEGKAKLDVLYFEIDEKSGKTVAVKSFEILED